MKRRLLNLLAAVSLALCVAMIAVYIRAYAHRDELHTSIFRHDCLIATFPHHLHVILADRAAICGYPTSITYGLMQYPARSKYFQPRYSNTGGYSEISIPFWLPFFFLSCAPLWVVGRAFRRLRRSGAGLCPECGYDLRASKDRCPECGKAIGEMRNDQ